MQWKKSNPVALSTCYLIWADSLELAVMALVVFFIGSFFVSGVKVLSIGIVKGLSELHTICIWVSEEPLSTLRRALRNLASQESEQTQSEPNCLLLYVGKIRHPSRWRSRSNVKDIPTDTCEVFNSRLLFIVLLMLLIVHYEIIIYFEIAQAYYWIWVATSLFYNFEL